MLCTLWHEVPADKACTCGPLVCMPVPTGNIKPVDPIKRG